MLFAGSGSEVQDNLKQNVGTRSGLAFLDAHKRSFRMIAAISVGSRIVKARPSAITVDVFKTSNTAMLSFPDYHYLNLKR